MSTQIQIRRGTAAAWIAAATVLAAGEGGLETDSAKIKYGDGVTAWASLPYTGGGSGGGGTWGSITGTLSSQADLQTALNAKAGTAVFNSGTNGLVPASGGGTTTFLRADGSFATPSGGGNISNTGTPTAGQAAEWTSSTVIQGVTVTGTGNYVKATSPTLVTPALGTPSSGALTNCTSIPGAQVTGTVPAASLGSGASISTKFLRGDNTWQSISGGGDALIANGLGQFAASTSASLAGVISDETGSGPLVFGTSPTLTTPTLSGVWTAAGASITTAAAMGALAIDITKAKNTKSISADSTFTFSGTPASDTWFGMYLTNTDASNPHTLTLPSAFSQITQGARTTCVIPPSGQLWMLWCYDGSNYKIFGDGPFLNNYAASTAPTTSNDISQGYGVGSFWSDTTGNNIYICKSNTAAAAVWTQINSGGGSGTVTHTGGSLTANALVLGAGTADTKVVAGIVSDGTSKLTLGVAGTSVGAIALNNATSGSITIAPVTGALGSVTISVPAVTDTLVTLGATQTLTSKTLTNAIVGTQTALDNSTKAASTAYVDLATSVSTINSQSAGYTLVLTDAGKTIFHPAADTTARTFTVPANGSVAYPVGTIITVDNDVGAGTLTIAITTDTLVLVGSAGSTGSRTLVAGGRAVMQKVASTRWRISGGAELT